MTNHPNRAKVSKITFDGAGNIRVDGFETPYFVREGSYRNTTDDRLGRWYVGCHSEPFRPFGAGFINRLAAANSIEGLAKSAADF